MSRNSAPRASAPLLKPSSTPRVRSRLIPPSSVGIVRRRGEGWMRPTALLTLAVAFATALMTGGCSSKCPRPFVYDEATLKGIQQALSNLPLDRIMRSLIHDYENEIVEFRFCLCLGHQFRLPAEHTESR